MVKNMKEVNKKVLAKAKKEFIINTINSIILRATVLIIPVIWSYALNHIYNAEYDKAIKLINGAIDLINMIPGVSISNISRLSLPRLAKGGIAESATTAIIGEAGREAVLPLDNNTEWMDKLADRIAARNSTPSKIVLQIGEKELGWATIGAINGITSQTGRLQLAL